MSLTLAIDYDGTIVEKTSPPRLRMGAARALAALAIAGHRLILHSCRCNPVDPTPAEAEEVSDFYRTGVVPPSAAGQWARFDEMRTFLKTQGMWALFHEVWQGPGKPICDMYVDDRTEVPNWPRIAAELGVIR